jgi:hypothetical protein
LRLRRSSTIEGDVKRTARCITVALVIFSWIAISNHCAFSALATTTDTTENECPFHPKPAKQKESAPNVQCCKILRATVATMAKSWARDDASFANVDLAIENFVVLTASHRVAPLLLDTGPPGKTSFLELIGSMRAHAPPCRA